MSSSAMDEVFSQHRRKTPSSFKWRRLNKNDQTPFVEAKCQKGILPLRIQFPNNLDEVFGQDNQLPCSQSVISPYIIGLQ